MKENVISFCKIIKKLNHILTKKQKRGLVGIFVIVVISACFELLGVTAILPFMQILLMPEQIMQSEAWRPVLELLQITSATQMMILLGVGMALLYIIKNIFIIFSYFVQYDYSSRVQKELSVRMLHSYMKRPYTFFLETNSAEILRGCNNDIDSVFLVISFLYTIAAELLSAAAIGTFIIITEPMIAIGVLVLMAIVMIAIIMVFKPVMKRIGRKNMKAQAEKNKAIYQAISGIKELFVMQRKDLFEKEYDSASDAVRITKRNYEFMNASPERIIEGICVSGLIGVILIRLLIDVNMVEFIPKLGTFAMAAFKILPAIGKITSRITSIVYCTPALENVYNNVLVAENYDREEKEHIQEFIEERKPVQFLQSLEISNVKWRYDNAQTDVLKNVSITIQKGESIALIGASGSGKTTLSDMILGLLHPQTGGIYMDGIDVFTMPVGWASVVGYVPQSVFLMDDTVRSNIAFGLQDVDDAEIWQALEKAQLKEFVEQLPDGLETVVGERGVKFSGGQRQRIAIARALYNKPQILVLDEATAALDNETETAVMESIDALQGQITMIIVAHRLTTIRNCDKIYEIKDGKATVRSKEEVLGEA